MSNVAGSMLAPGTTVAGYRIEALIGRGGMGAVYRASEEGLGRKVALKVIAPELAQDERFRERFLRESRIAASLDHPHIVPIYQAGEDDGVLFLAMRYVEGSDLAKLVAENGALAPKRTVELPAGASMAGSSGVGQSRTLDSGDRSSPGSRRTSRDRRSSWFGSGAVTAGPTRSPS